VGEKSNDPAHDFAPALCYIRVMTKEQIEAIFDRVRTWPAERLEDVAAVLLAMEEANEDDDLTDEDWADLEEGLAEADRGEFASDEEVKAVLDRYR
jgi:hypothetical protein